MRRSYSPGEQKLAHAVSARVGRPITPRQIERWRDEGYARPLDHEWYGKGRGSSSSVAPLLVDEVAAFAAALKPGMPLNEAALTVFAGCGPISERAVRNAYQAFFAKTEKLLRQNSTAASEQEVARQSAPTLLRPFMRTTDATRWRQRFRDAGVDPQDALLQICETLVVAGLGGTVKSREAIEHFLVGSGLAAAATEKLGDIGPWADRLPVERIQQLLPQFSFPALRTRIDKASFADVLRARNYAKDFVTMLEAVVPVIADTSATKEALGFREIVHHDASSHVPMLVPTMLIFEDLGYPIAEMAKLSRTIAPFYQAVRTLLQTMPRFYRRFLGPSGIDELNRRPLAERKQFIRHLGTATKTHPDAREIVAAGMPAE